jgi:hypothetical protein
MIGVNRFDCSFDEASVAAETLMKASSTPNFGGAVTGEMSASAMNEARCVAVGTKKAGPIVFVSVMLGRCGWLVPLHRLRVFHLVRSSMFRVWSFPKQVC